MTFTVPQYSFIQLATTEAGCCPDPAFCLPLSSASNLQFYGTLGDIDMSLFPSANQIIGCAFVVPTDMSVPSDMSHYHPYGSHSSSDPAPLIMATHFSPGVPPSGGTMTMHFDYPQNSLPALVSPGDCFKLMLTYTPIIVGGTVWSTYFIGFTCCFQYTDTSAGSCYTSVLTYSNNSDAFGFQFVYGKPNVVELPMYLRDPKMENDQKVYTKSDGTLVKLYERKEETYTLETDLMPYAWHKALDIALSQDNVSIANANASAFDPYNTATQFVKKENYEIEYQKAPLSALGKGTCKLSNADAINLINNNCA